MRAGTTIEAVSVLVDPVSMFRSDSPCDPPYHSAGMTSDEDLRMEEVKKPSW